MLTKEKVHSILNINESYEASSRIMDIMYNPEERRSVFLKFLAEDSDVSQDTFHNYFMDNHSDRKNLKQDFTPKSVANLLSAITQSDNPHSVYDPTAGTGGLIISKWYNEMVSHSIFDYYPNDYLYTCEELSSNTIPFLLFNLCIRGMNAIVIHCDTLSRKAYGAFLIQNPTNDFMAFSNFNVLPYNENIEKLLNIKFVEERYEQHIENDISLCYPDNY